MLIDLLWLGLLLWAGFKGYKRGLIVGVFSFVAVLVGLIAAVKLSVVAADYMRQYTSIAGGWDSPPFFSGGLSIGGAIDSLG
jgi:membrane protein required for colicin V production